MPIIVHNNSCCVYYIRDKYLQYFIIFSEIPFIIDIVMDFGAQQFPGNNNRAHPPNNEHMIHARDRVFHALFHHIAMMYVNVVPRCMRQCLEIFLLLKVCELMYFITQLDMNGIDFIHCTF